MKYNLGYKLSYIANKYCEVWEKYLPQISVEWTLIKAICLELEVKTLIFFLIYSA
jgi:hypothetical protein